VDQPFRRSNRFVGLIVPQFTTHGPSVRITSLRGSGCLLPWRRLPRVGEHPLQECVGANGSSQWSGDTSAPGGPFFIFLLKAKTTRFCGEQSRRETSINHRFRMRTNNLLKMVRWKRISIQSLEGELSSAIAEAEAGETILINAPHMRGSRAVGACSGRHIFTSGRLFGKGRNHSCCKEGTNGRYPEASSEDRDDRWKQP